MTGPYAESLMEIIDSRVSAGTTVNRRTGTVVSRDSTGPWAAVNIDPSSLAIPVKVAAHVEAFAGDRVVLEKYGSDWVVMGSFTKRGPARGVFTGHPGTGQTSSSSYVDVPGPVTVSLTKMYDLSNVLVRVTTTSRITVASVDTVVLFGLAITGTDHDVSQTTCNPNNTTFGGSGCALVTGVPAGTYTCTLRWRRTAGTSVVDINSTDWVTVSVEEVGP